MLENLLSEVSLSRTQLTTRRKRFTNHHRRWQWPVSSLLTQFDFYHRLVDERLAPVTKEANYRKNVGVNNRCSEAKSSLKLSRATSNRPCNFSSHQNQCLRKSWTFSSPQRNTGWEQVLYERRHSYTVEFKSLLSLIAVRKYWLAENTDTPKSQSSKLGHNAAKSRLHWWS